MSAVFEINLDKDEKPLAKSFLQSDKDDSNVIYLTSNRLILVRKSKVSEFLLSTLSSVYISTKKLLFPIIAGGILSSLCIAALGTNTYNPYYLLLGFLAGLALLYWGYTGSRALCIVEGNHETNLFLRSFAEPLHRFVDFVNQYKNTPSSSLLKFYLVVSNSNQSEHFTKTPLLTFNELMNQANEPPLFACEIDSTEPGMEVTYKVDQNTGRYRPFLEDTPSPEDLHFVPVHNLKQLFSETF